MQTIYELSKMWNINPLFLIGLFLFGQSFIYGLRLNSKLHKMKDDKIDKLEKDLKHTSEKLELVQSLKRQTEMFAKN